MIKRLLIAAIAAIVVVTPAAAFRQGKRVVTRTACPTGGLVASSGTTALTADCTITGNVTLSGRAALKMTGGTLTIDGNTALSGNSVILVSGGGMAIKATFQNQYTFTLTDYSSLQVDNSTFKTSDTGALLTLTLDLNGHSAIYGTNATLVTTNGSWALCNLFDNSKLITSGSQDFPTEVYPGGASTVSITNSYFATVFFDFLSGSVGTLNVPQVNGSSHFDLSFGRSPGFDYFVKMTNSQSRIGVASYPNSSATVIGTGSGNDAKMQISYYVQDNTGPVTINSLPVNGVVNYTLTDQGRLLRLTNVTMGIFGWHVYVKNSNGYVTTVNNSFINEAAVLSPGGLLDIVNSTMQYAALVSAGAGSIVNVSGSQIWSNQVAAQVGGHLNITGSTIHGNQIFGYGPGANVNFTTTTDARNGTLTSCPGDPPPHNGASPLCNPGTPLQACATVSQVSGGTVTPGGVGPSCP